MNYTYNTNLDDHTNAERIDSIEDLIFEKQTELDNLHKKYEIILNKDSYSIELYKLDDEIEILTDEIEELEKEKSELIENEDDSYDR